MSYFHFSFWNLGLPGVTLCGLALYAVILTALVKTGRLPKDAVQSFYNWSHLQLLFSFLFTGISGIIKSFQTMDGPTIKLFCCNISEVLLALSINIIVVYLLILLVAAATRKWPLFSKAVVFQILFLFADLCMCIGLSLLTVLEMRR